MDNFRLQMVLLGAVIVVMLTFVITCEVLWAWRPLVSQWGERTSQHQAAPIEVPERIIWNGVEYDCVLREKEGE